MSIRVRSTSGAPSLQADMVHVWWTAAVLKSVDINVLSDSERERAEQFHFEEHRRLFLARRSLLRWLLGLYLDEAPTSIEIRTERYGRPFVERPRTDVFFSLSHSMGAVMVALARKKVGVDLEHHRPQVDVEGITTRMFSSGEQAEIARLDEPQRLQAFFTCWTHKEAVCKADGRGLHAPLETVDVSSALRCGAAMTRIPSRTGEYQQWRSYSVHLERNISAACAVPAETDIRLIVHRL